MNPAKHERKSNQSRDDASPHDEEVHGPAREATLKNESLRDEIGGERLGSARCIRQELFALQIKFPAALPINASRGPLQPNRVTKHDCAECDDARDGIAEQCRI